MATVWSGFIASVVHIATAPLSPTTQCVWNSIDAWDHLNGEYTLNGTFNTNFGTYSYWTHSSPSCPDSTQYVYAKYYAEDSLHYWVINPSLNKNWIAALPECGNDGTLASDPSQCETGWSIYQNKAQFDDIPLTVTAQQCPILPCGRIHITGSKHTSCDQIFSKDFAQNYVYANTDTSTYLYFNPYTFKWYCSDTLDIDNCDDDNQINHQYLSSKTDEWIDVSINGAFDLMMSNDETATFECLVTAEPTISPTIFPTIDPTMFPTFDPTNPPTMDPSIQPSIESTIEVSTEYIASMYDSNDNGITMSNNENTLTAHVIGIGGGVIGLLCIGIIGMVIWKRTWIRFNDISLDRIRSLDKIFSVSRSSGLVSPPASPPASPKPNSKQQNENNPVCIWLISAVGLPQYLDFFIKHGYDSIEAIETIQDKEALENMGIIKKGHQTLILEEIQSLQDTAVVSTDANVIVSSVQLVNVAVDNVEKSRSVKAVNVEFMKESYSSSDIDSLLDECEGVEKNIQKPKGRVEVTVVEYSKDESSSSNPKVNSANVTVYDEPDGTDDGDI